MWKKIFCYSKYLNIYNSKYSKDMCKGLKKNKLLLLKW